MDDGIGVRISELSRRYGDTVAVDTLSLEIRRGETFGLLGPNGAGKTTTLGMLATLVEPSDGDAEIFGASLRREVKQVKRQVGLAPQQICLYPNLTGGENLSFFGRVYGLERGVVRERSERLLDLVGLSQRRDHEPF